MRFCYGVYTPSGAKIVTQALQQRLEECMLDQRWRLNNLYRITTKEGVEVDFRMNAAQEDFYDNLWSYNVILKARRLGFSTLIQILMLDMCLFHPNTHCGIIAQSKDDAEAIFAEKIKFAYDRLPKEIREAITARTDSKGELSFSNGSKIRVGTSLRGGTLQALHVSEYGKIGARYPDKAKEIRTGALNTVHAGQFIFIESTAEGRGGEFFELCELARKVKTEGRKLTSLDPRFFFYPWHRDPDCILDPDGVSIPAEMAEYFADLEELDIYLRPEQKAWYVRKAEQQRDAMKQEFPSTPDEPFEVATEGTYYGREMQRVRKDRRITRLPVETRFPINTFWDLGRNDYTAIWLHQQVAREDRFIGFYQNNGHTLTHYVKWLQDWLPEDCVWGTHYLPHDAGVTDLSRTDNLTREEVINDAGLKGTYLITRAKDIRDGIEATRQAFPSAWFDGENCAAGIDCLDNYRRRWDDVNGVWTEHPQRSVYNHGADAFRMWAEGYRGEEDPFPDMDLPKVVRV